MAIFVYEQRVMFQHCDPAQIVFYPRYFEMVNATIETWFEEIAKYSFVDMFNSAGGGVPTAAIDARFHAPSRLGDMLCWRLNVVKLGNSSIAFEIEARCNDELRMSVKTTLVHVNAKTGKSSPLPTDARENITQFMEGQ